MRPRIFLQTNQQILTKKVTIKNKQVNNKAENGVSLMCDSSVGIPRENELQPRYVFEGADSMKLMMNERHGKK